MRRKLTQKPFTVLLPLWPKVVFVDWNGVLCHDVYWTSIATNAQHPIHKNMVASRARLFTENRALVNAWQKGEISSESVIDSLNLRLDKRFGKDFLLRRLKQDCRAMRTDATFLAELAVAREHAYIVLATDNVDSFFEQLDSKPELHAVLDGVLCSSAIGLLKAENIVGFFEPWLKSHSLTFAQSLLIDDSPSICTAFRSAGGNTIEFKSVQQASQDLRKWLSPDKNACGAPKT